VSVLLARVEADRRERRLVRRVGEALGFERDAVVAAEHRAPVPDERPVEEVPGVELQRGLRRLERERAAARGVDQPRDRTQTVAAQCEGVVVAAAALRALDLREACAERRGTCEVERPVAHRRALAGGNAVRIHGQHFGRVELERVVEHRARTAVGQIPVGVAGERDHRRPARARAQLERERVVLGERVRRLGLEPSGVPLVAVGAHEREAERIAAALRRPRARREARGAAVQVVRAVVARQHVLHAVERVAPARDAVRHASDDDAQVRVRRVVARGVRKAEQHVDAPEDHAHERRAARRQHYPRAAAVAQLDRLPHPGPPAPPSGDGSFAGA